jgi:hypothetical protein
MEAASEPRSKEPTTGWEDKVLPIVYFTSCVYLGKRYDGELRSIKTSVWLFYVNTPVNISAFMINARAKADIIIPLSL